MLWTSILSDTSVSLCIVRRNSWKQSDNEPANDDSNLPISTIDCCLFIEEGGQVWIETHDVHRRTKKWIYKQHIGHY